MIINSVDELNALPSYKEAIIDLLYQLADDDFLNAYRGSEWLGLAPHIEEDVAFSSITQDTMGHAAMLYQLLENIGEGKADDLSHGRSASERKNSVLVELANGTGNYLVEPKYDWAFTVVRNYFYTQAKKVKMESLKVSSYKPLAEVAVKINMELYYHIMHWKVWFTQLTSANEDARNRMVNAIDKVFADFGAVLSLGDQHTNLAKHSIIESEELLKKRWIATMTPVFEDLSLSIPKSFASKNGNGRDGNHTEDLELALKTLSEVYRLDKAANW